MTKMENEVSLIVKWGKILVVAGGVCGVLSAAFVKASGIYDNNKIVPELVVRTSNNEKKIAEFSTKLDTIISILEKRGDRENNAR